MADLDCVEDADCAEHRDACRRFLDERDRHYTKEFRGLHDLTERLFNGMTSTIKSIEGKIPTQDQLRKAAEEALSGESCQKRMGDIAKTAADQALRDARDLSKGTLDIKTVVIVLLFAIGVTASAVTVYLKIAGVGDDLREHINKEQVKK